MPLTFQDIYTKHEWRIKQVDNGPGWVIVDNDGEKFDGLCFAGSETPASIVEAHNKTLYLGMKEELLAIYKEISKLSA